jgi:hypothetical protein
MLSGASYERDREVEFAKWWIDMQVNGFIDQRHLQGHDAYTGCIKAIWASEPYANFNWPDLAFYAFGPVIGFWLLFFCSSWSELSTSG